VTPRVLGVIPARGGSKRIPRKNCRLLRGVPLIAYTIRAAQAASQLTDWVVSTEDQEIATLANSYGARVIKRPVELAEDDTTSGAVACHALDWMEDDRRYDMVVLLHPTSPIRDPLHIDQAIKKLWDSRHYYSRLASVYELPQKTHTNLFDASLYPVKGPANILNASIYAVTRDQLLKDNKHAGWPFVPFWMDRYHSLDIDEECDLKVGELYLDALSA
jgi:CMP-N,N'-diacetyllegionaminic acid synthase